MSGAPYLKQTKASGVLSTDFLNVDVLPNNWAWPSSLLPDLLLAGSKIFPSEELILFLSLKTELSRRF